MRYMLIETFKPGRQQEIYRRLEDEGRQLPGGLRYIDSWIDEGVTRCFQLMECEDPALLQRWTARWRDLTDFEIVAVISSAEARQKVAAQA